MTTARKIDWKTLIAHLKRTGKLKLLPQILRELKREEAHAEKLAPRKETVKQHPALISGWREIENGTLTDRSGKRALLEIYQKVVGHS